MCLAPAGQSASQHTWYVVTCGVSSIPMVLRLLRQPRVVLSQAKGILSQVEAPRHGQYLGPVSRHLRLAHSLQAAPQHPPQAVQLVALLEVATVVCVLAEATLWRLLDRMLARIAEQFFPPALQLARAVALVHHWQLVASGLLQHSQDVGGAGTIFVTDKHLFGDPAKFSQHWKQIGSPRPPAVVAP